MKKILMIISLLFILSGCFKQELTPENTTEIQTKLELNYGDSVSSVTESNEVINYVNSLTKNEKGELNGIYQSNYQKGLIDFFDINNKIEITIDITEEQIEYLNINHEKNNRESYQNCNIDIRINDVIFHYENVGIRQKGNTSRGSITTDNKINLRHYKLNFAETFDDEFRVDSQELTKEQKEYYKNRTFFGLKKLDLRWNRNSDSTYTREYYSYELYRLNGILSARSNVMNLKFKINNKVENLGLYLGVEPIDKSFIERNLTKDYLGGDLYKLGWSNVGAVFDSVESELFGKEEQYVGNDENVFWHRTYPYDLKTNSKTSSHEDIKNFINKLNQTPIYSNYDVIKEITHYDSFLKYLAISYLLGDPDDLRGNYNNTYIYFLPDGKAIFMPNDHDRTLGSTGGTGNPTGHHGALNKPYDENTGYSGKNQSPLFTKTILKNGNANIKQDYYQMITTIINNDTFKNSTFKKYYEIIKNNYSDCVKLSKNINNETVKFNLVEDKQLDSAWNLTVEIYINKKRAAALI